MNSVVVYRNPFEQWMWESGTISWVAFALLTVITSTILYLTIDTVLYNKTKLSRRARNITTNTLFLIIILVVLKLLYSVII